MRGFSNSHRIRAPSPGATELSGQQLRFPNLHDAGILYIVEQTLAVIPRSAFLPEHITQKISYRISGKFKRPRRIAPFFVEL
jgi:hypothetical protein